MKKLSHRDMFKSLEKATLELRRHENSLWGRINFGRLGGIINIQILPADPVGKLLDFKWKGHDYQTDDKLYGSNDGQLTVSPDGKITGWINFLGKLKFRGGRKGGGRAGYRALKTEWGKYEASNDEDDEDDEEDGSDGTFVNAEE